MNCTCIDNKTNNLPVKGIICKKPILTTTPLGSYMVNTIIASTKQNGNIEYWSCIATGELANTIIHIPIGGRIIVDGAIRRIAYLKNGEHYFINEIIVHNFILAKTS